MRISQLKTLYSTFNCTPTQGVKIALSCHTLCSHLSAQSVLEITTLGVILRDWSFLSSFCLELPFSLTSWVILHKFFHSLRAIMMSSKRAIGLPNFLESLLSSTVTKISTSLFRGKWSSILSTDGPTISMQHSGKKET